LKKFPEEEYHIPFFDEYGYIRKQCPICKEYYWTQKPECTTCGESTSEGCTPYTFIKNPPTKKRYTLREMRDAFLSFFEKRGHERIKPYPVVARWRDDIYFTHASIIDFQPYVTEGIVPPPANPLVISQPCIRFVDIDNVGPTFGRHLSIFEMGGHHAFNYPDKEVYWKDETVRFHHEFVTKELGVPSDEVIYKEGVWIGGGNAGPDLESIVRGLELATLVFMKYKVVDNQFLELPIRTVDTGYGIERYTWISQGTSSCFQAVYDNLLEKIMKIAKVDAVDEELLAKIATFSGMCNLEKTVSRKVAREIIAKHVGIDVETLEKILLPLEAVFAVADHTKCLVFMLAEGVVPSNTREGYLTRLMIRRTYRLLKMLGIEENLFDIINLQIKYWSQDFSQLIEMQNEILEILSVEKEKYEQTLRTGKSYVKRIAHELKTKKQQEIPVETLIELYNSHGLPPEVVKETLEEEKIKIEVPENFYKLVAERNIQAPQERQISPFNLLESKLTEMPQTRMLFYVDPYQKEFEAKVLKIIDNEFIVLNQTLFYPEGGGQPADQGQIIFNGNSCKVIDVQKVGKVIVHKIEGKAPREGMHVKGIIDWERRSQLMRHHTATHVLMGAARRVLGQHVWQAGTQKEIEYARLDISHYRKLSTEEIHKIEALANQIVLDRVPVETTWMQRNEAEKLYGFRLYQGGAIPGKEIRVVKTGDWEVEACAGTHVKNTSEIGFIKIIHTERIQDGVERIVFSAGLPALEKIQKKEKLLIKLSEVLQSPIDKLQQTVDKLLTEWKETRRKNEILQEQLALAFAKECLETAKEINGIKIVVRAIKGADAEYLIKLAGELTRKEPKIVAVLFGTTETTIRIVVMAGKESLQYGINAKEIASQTASILGGGGSGRNDFAQGGGTKLDKISEALQKTEKIIKQQLGIGVTN